MWSKTWSKCHTRSPDGQHAWTRCVHTIQFSTLSDPQMLKEVMNKISCISNIHSHSSHILMLSAKMRPQSIGRGTELAANVTTEARGGGVLGLDMVIN